MNVINIGAEAQRFDADSIEIYKGNDLIKSVSATEEQMKIGALNNTGTLIIKTVGEARRESAGVFLK